MATPLTVFISHAHADNAICAQIALSLRQQGIDVWIDLTNLQDGRSLSGDITYELLQRQVFVLMLTSTSNASYWVGEELDIFISYARDQRTRIVDGVERKIIPVLLQTNLEIEVQDAQTRRNRASNWARVFNLKAIDGVNKPQALIVQEIARAVGISIAHIGTQPDVIVTPPPPPSSIKMGQPFADRSNLPEQHPPRVFEHPSEPIEGKWGASGRLTTWAILLRESGGIIQGEAMQLSILGDVMDYQISGKHDGKYLSLSLVYTRNHVIKAEMTLQVLQSSLSGKIIENDKIERPIEFHRIK